jgi:hypothetical protein
MNVAALRPGLDYLVRQKVLRVLGVVSAHQGAFCHLIHCRPERLAHLGRHNSRELLFFHLENFARLDHQARSFRKRRMPVF